MRRIPGVAIGLWSALAAAAAPAQGTLEERIARVENGLAPHVLVGRDAGTWKLAERLAHYKVPGLAVAVINGGKLEWSRQYGVRDAKGGQAVDATTLFQVASITKPVAATVALKLVEKGVLDLDRDVNAYLKSWKVPENDFTREQKVTLRHLLSHSAGLTVQGFRGYAAGEPVPSILQVLDGTPPANNDPVRVDSAPGTRYRYSGGGYTVLQLLVEDVTGRPLPELVDEMILKPAGLTHSSIADPLPARLAGLRAAGHGRDGVPFAGHSFVRGGSACCGLWTTASDLAGFAVETQRALRGESGALMTPATARSMSVPTGSESMGLGWALARHGSAVYLNHGGGNPGFSSYLIFHPTAGHGVAILTNSDNGGRLAQEIVLSVAQEYGWEGIRPQRFASADALVDEVRALRQADPMDPRVAEGRLNQLGYELLADGQGPAALRVFALNAELNPRSANCQDSLAEALERGGDLGAAISSYKQAVELLERFPEPNQGYARHRERTLARIAELERQAAKLAIGKDEVIRRAWKAMFGDREDKDIRSLTVEGYFHGATVPNRITVKRPNLFRNETKSGVLVFDGTRAAWATRAPDQAGNPRGPELIEPKSWRHFEVDIALVFPAFFDHPAELKGIAKVNGSDAYELSVTLPLGGIVTYFVDAGSFLVTRRLVWWDGADGTDPWENTVDGWLDADGIRFPDGYLFEGRQGREKGLYKNVRFNVQPDDEVFRIPEELK